MIRKKSIWYKYEVVKLAEIIGDNKISARSLSFRHVESFNKDQVYRWRKDINNLALPPTFNQHMLNVSYDEDLPVKPLFNDKGMSTYSIPGKIKEIFFRFIDGQKINVREKHSLIDYDLVEDNFTISFFGKTLLATREKNLKERCNKAEIPIDNIVCCKLNGSNEFSVGAYLSKGKKKILHTEHLFINIFLDYLTYTYYTSSRLKYRPIEDLRIIKAIDTVNIIEENIEDDYRSLKNSRSSTIFGRKTNVANRIFTRELYDFRISALLQSNSLWKKYASIYYEICDRFEAYRIYNLIGYEKWRELMDLYISNPDAMEYGWPDLFLYDESSFEFVEVKVTDNVSDKQLQTLRLLNLIFPNSVKVVKARITTRVNAQ